MRKRRRFSQEFKLEAVRMVVGQGRDLFQVCEDLDIPPLHSSSDTPILDEFRDQGIRLGRKRIARSMIHPAMDSAESAEYAPRFQQPLE